MNEHTPRTHRPETLAIGGTTVIRTVLLATILAWAALLSALRAEGPPTTGPTDPPSAIANIAADEDAFVARIAALAVVERMRSGVPASITAAQAILESDWGRAPIAAEGNNYFGIKCKRTWRGATVAHVDDDRDAAGRLVESCFRAYGSLAESFRDHSTFLTESDRYAKLFDVDPLDYRGWARGLKASGYATDHLYADKLIAIIERLELYTLDWPEVMHEQWLVALSEPELGVDLGAVRASEFLRPSPATRAARAEATLLPATALRPVESSGVATAY